MAWICDKNGVRKCEVKRLSYNGVFMDVSSITVTIEAPSPIDFAIGDYIDWDYDGMRYTLDASAAVEKQARRNSIGNAFIYENLVFLSPLSAAEHADFLDVVIGNQLDFHTNTEFSFFGTAWDYAKRLEANLCRLYGAGSWKVRIWTNGVCYDSAPATLDTGAWEGKLVDVSRIRCLAGFQQIYDLWGCAYVFSVVNGVNYVDFYDDFELYAKAWEQEGVAKIFAYGKGNGLYKIRHTQDADHVLVTRLRAYGSSENIPANYYLNSPLYHVDGNESSELAIANLMLPASEWTKGGVKHPSNAYIEQNVDLYGVREASVYWDGSDSELGEIKPTIYKLTIQDLLNYMSAGEPYRPVESKWPDTTQRIDEIITGAQPADNGVVKEAGYDFTVVYFSLSFLSRDLGDMLVDKEVKFGDLVMSALFPMISDLAEYRLVPQGDDHRVVSFVVPGANASSIRSVSAYITPYIGTRMVENATIPMKVVPRAVTVDNETTMHYEIFLEDSSENFIVFSASRTGALRFSIRALIDYTTEDHETFEVHRYEHALNFNVVRGGKVIDKFFSVIVPQVGFDLAAAVSSGAMLCMRSGYNQPREFPIVPSSVRYNADSDTWYVRCKRVPDDSIGTYFPNSDAPIVAGDEYYFTGIAMPALFVEIAAQRLLSAASAWLALHSKPRMLSSVDVDNKIMAEEGIVLKEGMSLPLNDTDLGITPGTQESRVIDNIRIEEGESSIRTFSITLRDKKERSSLDAAIRGATSGLATTSSVNAVAKSVQQQEHGSLSGRDMPDQHPISSITGLEEALMSNSFFELDDDGNVKLKDQYNGLWAKGFITAGGEGSSESGGGGADLQSVWLSLKTNEDEFANEKIHVAHIPSLPWSIIGSGKPDTLGGYGITDAYTKTQVDNLIGAIDQFHYEIYPSLASITIPAGNVLYLIGPTGTGSDKYEEYVYANSTFTKIGDTTIDLSPYLTIASAQATYQPIINDLATIRTRANEGHSAYEGLPTISDCLLSLQSQLDSVASRDNYDELTATAFYADTAAVSSLYAGAISLDGADLAGSLSSLSSRASILESRATSLEGRASILEGYFTNGSANSALRLTTVSKTAWGQTYWTSSGIPDSVSGNMSDVGNISMNGSISGATTITASGLIKTTNYMQAARFYLSDSVYFVLDANGVKLEGAGFYTDSFVTAGGVNSSGGGGGEIDLDRVWESLTNNIDFPNTKINPAHIPDMASAYGYLKGNQTITLTGVVTGSGTTSIATNIADGALSIAKVNGLQAALNAKQDVIPDLATIRSNAANGNTAYGWGTTISDCLRSLQSQIDAVASRSDCDELSATDIYADVFAGSTAYFGTVYGVLSGTASNATNADNADKLDGVHANGLFTELTTSAGSTNLYITIGGTRLSKTVYAYYDSDGGVIASNMTTIGAALRSIQSQVDSVASRNCFEELAATSFFADMLSVGTNAVVGGAIDVKGAASVGSSLSVSSTANLYGALNVSGLATVAGGLKLTTTKKIWFDDTHYIELDSNGHLHTNAGFYSDSFITAGGVNATNS